MKTKLWFCSRTLWVNFLVALAIVIQTITGTAWLDAELQAAIIVILNVLLRLITKQGLS